LTRQTKGNTGLWQPGANAGLRRLAGSFGSVYLLFLAVLGRLFTNTPLVAAVPGSQLYFLAVGAFYRILRKVFAVGCFTIGFKNDTGGFGGEAAR
jgi:hypothetical protein